MVNGIREENFFGVSVLTTHLTYTRTNFITEML